MAAIRGRAATRRIRLRTSRARSPCRRRPRPGPRGASRSDEVASGHRLVGQGPLLVGGDLGGIGPPVEDRRVPSPTGRHRRPRRCRVTRRRPGRRPAPPGPGGLRVRRRGLPGSRLPRCGRPRPRCWSRSWSASAASSPVTWAAVRVASAPSTDVPGRLFVLEDGVADVAPGSRTLGSQGVELGVHLGLEARRRIRRRSCRIGLTHGDVCRHART